MRLYAGTKGTRKRTYQDKNKLYDVDIVERDAVNKRCKLHYVGYSSNFDVWVNDEDQEYSCPVVKLIKKHIPSESTFNDRRTSFLDELICEIQRQLTSHRLVNPEIRVAIKGDMDVFSSITDLCTSKVIVNKTFFIPNELQDLDCVLGSHWKSL